MFRKGLSHDDTTIDHITTLVNTNNNTSSDNNQQDSSPEQQLEISNGIDILTRITNKLRRFTLTAETVLLKLSALTMTATLVGTIVTVV